MGEGDCLRTEEERAAERVTRWPVRVGQSNPDL